MENCNHAESSNPITGLEQNGANDTEIKKAKESWTSPTLTRLSGKETEGKVWDSPVERSTFSGPS